MSETFYCPRSLETGGGPNSVRKPPFNGEATYRADDDTCTYCGSLNPATFMARLEAGDVELGPTDKSYKVYVENKGGAPFKMAYRKCPPHPAPRCPGPDDCPHWTVEERSGTKFYFQHLSVEQRQRFVELLNEKRLHIGMPGHFYVLPFFCRPLA